MDFARVLELLGSYLDEHQVRWAVCGDQALAAYGLARTSLGIDAIVDGDHDIEVVAFLEASGYQTIFRSCAVSNHVHQDAALGRIDLMFIRFETADKLFASVRDVPVPGGRSLHVPKPEHLAAMKAAAIKADPGRAFQDLADIRFLLTLPGVDRDEVQGYFARYGLEKRFDELVETL
jgi:hypothetical protein